MKEVNKRGKSNLLQIVLKHLLLEQQILHHHHISTIPLQ